MHFSDQTLEEIQREYLSVSSKYQGLLEAYMARNYRNLEAREYAIHGFLRRLKTLVRCIHNVFGILPPDRIEIPTNGELHDVAINIQAFVINVFGTADNLARIWVLERDLAKEDGSAIPDNWTGLRKKNKFIRHSFSPEFQQYLQGLDCWFCLLENFRHALAHRITLYVPPYMVPDDKKKVYHDLDRQMTEAFKQRDFEEHDRLEAEQRALAAFIPYMTHSFVEEAKFVLFHGQILTDFNTIDDLGRRMLRELDR